jgi:hypothetical protein
LSSGSVACVCPTDETYNSAAGTCDANGAAADVGKPSYGNGSAGLSIGVPIAIIVGILVLTAIAYIIYTKAWRNLGKSKAVKTPNNLELQAKTSETKEEVPEKVDE